MTHDQSTDISLVRLLAAAPAFRQWEHRPLPDPLQQLVRNMDEQTLMTLTVHALRRLSAEEPAGTARRARLREAPEP